MDTCAKVYISGSGIFVFLCYLVHIAYIGAYSYKLMLPYHHGLTLLGAFLHISASYKCTQVYLAD